MHILLFSTSQIDIFGQQQPNLESQLKNLSQGLGKYIERQTEVYERDIQRVGEMFSKVHQAVQMDTTTIGKYEIYFLILIYKYFYFQGIKNCRIQSRKSVDRIMEWLNYIKLKYRKYLQGKEFPIVYLGK
jgi:hypothetical protein